MVSNASGEKVVRCITSGDFFSLLKGKTLELDNHINRLIEQGESELVIRYLFEYSDGDSIPFPYYLWAVYPLVESESKEVEMYPPDYEDIKTYLRTPPELKDKEFYEIPLTHVKLKFGSD